MIHYDKGVIISEDAVVTWQLLGRRTLLTDVFIMNMESQAGEREGDKDL